MIARRARRSPSRNLRSLCYHGDVTHPTRAAYESAFILCVWCFFCTWVILYCAGHYLPPESLPPEANAVEPADAMIAGPTGDSPEAPRQPLVPEFPTIAGLPVWVFWGIAVPWSVASAVTVGFALFGIKEEDEGV